MAATLASLGDHDVGAAVGDPFCVARVAGDAQDLDSGPVGVLDHELRVAEPGAEQRHLLLDDRLDRGMRPHGGAAGSHRSVDVGQSELLLDLLDEVAVLLGQLIDHLLQRGLLGLGELLVARPDQGGRQQDVDPEGLVGELLDLADLIAHFLNGESCASKHTQSAGLGDRHHQLHRRAGPLADQAGTHPRR